MVRPKIKDTLKDVETSLKLSETLALTDALTGMYNRTFYDENFAKNVLDASENDTKLCILIMDVDHFKPFNDTYGHQVGDEVLTLIAEIIFNKIRGADFVIRYGGDEIVVLLTNTEMGGVCLVAERIHTGVKTRRIKLPLTNKYVTFEITLSIGVAQLKKGQDSSTFFKKADNNLYKAKELGRDRIICDE